MKIALPALLVCLLLVTQSIAPLSSTQPTAAVQPTAAAQPAPPPPKPGDPSRLAVEQAIRTAIDSEAGTAELPVFLLYETQITNLQVTRDNLWAAAWLVPLDAQTGQVVPAEPGLVLAQNGPDGWQVSLPSDPAWQPRLLAAPESLIPAGVRDYWLASYASHLEHLPSAPLTGYLLPWDKGRTLYLSQSVGHDKYTPDGSAHFAFDFYWPGTMFNVYASKAGRVKYARWECTAGIKTCANWLVLEDLTTSPTTYQLYLHLDQNSIPVPLRTIGVEVRQGQFIGVADNTGQSSGHHLHFHVHTNPNSYWGTSVDITFQDVAINGGRPRVYEYDINYCKASDVCTSFSKSYVSGNTVYYADQTPPAGDILAPEHGVTVETGQRRLDGWASDADSGLLSAQFVARYGETWHKLGSPSTDYLFGMDWDLCAAGVPDGPVSLALEITDRAYNRNYTLPGLRHFTKNYACPIAPPACQPGANQVALFSGTDFSGACLLLGPGNYSGAAGLGAVGENNTRSLRVGSGVRATLFGDLDQQGRSETFTASDSSLADNRVGAAATRSVLVQANSALPVVPGLTWPLDKSSFSAASSFTLAGVDRGGGAQFQAELSRAGGETRSLPWQSEPVWSLGSLAAGEYTWKVRASNNAGQSAWSATRGFTVQPPAGDPPSPLTAPITDTLESGAALWAHNGAWELIAAGNHTPDGAAGWHYKPPEAGAGYNSPTANSGDLTGPPILIPAGGPFYLRFWYVYETEGPGPYWDQRWIQISVDGGPFTNLAQLSGDPANYWLHYPALRLPAEAGQTVQVRFHFATLDNTLNAFQGWFIDDLSITAEPPPACPTGDEPDDSPAQARAIQYGQELAGVICPGGDRDFFRFSGKAGDQVGIRAAAQEDGSPLDTQLVLLDSDGRSPLAGNDDQVFLERTDSAMSYRLTRDGDYYIGIQGWDHPMGGSPAHTYRLALFRDDQDPTLTFVTPLEGGFIPTGPLTLTVTTGDAGSGLSRVRFLVHSADWQDGVWEVVGEDWDGQDGWSVVWDGLDPARKSGMAFYAQAYDWAGNEIGAGAWNLRDWKDRIFLPLVRRKTF